MSTLYKEENNSYRIQFNDGEKNRQSVRLGNIPKKVAMTIQSRLDEIIACRLAGVSYSSETAIWIGNMPDDLHEKLAKKGFFPARKTAKVDAYIQEYIKRRHDIPKPVKNSG